MDFGELWEAIWSGRSSQDRTKIDSKRHRKKGLGAVMSTPQGRLGASWGVWERLGDVLGASWSALERLRAVLDRLGSVLEPLGNVLERLVSGLERLGSAMGACRDPKESKI